MKINLPQIRQKYEISIDFIRKLTIAEDKIQNGSITENLIVEISGIYAVK